MAQDEWQIEVDGQGWSLTFAGIVCSPIYLVRESAEMHLEAVTDCMKQHDAAVLKRAAAELTSSSMDYRDAARHLEQKAAELDGGT